MINIRIDVHKKTCVVTVKNQTAKILEQTEFSNTSYGIKKLAGQIKKRCARRRIRAVCEATRNCWGSHQFLRSRGSHACQVRGA